MRRRPYSGKRGVRLHPARSARTTKSMSPRERYVGSKSRPRSRTVDRNRVAQDRLYRCPARTNGHQKGYAFRYPNNRPSAPASRAPPATKSTDGCWPKYLSANLSVPGRYCSSAFEPAPRVAPPHGQPLVERVVHAVVGLGEPAHPVASLFPASPCRQATATMSEFPPFRRVKALSHSTVPSPDAASTTTWCTRRPPLASATLPSSATPTWSDTEAQHEGSARRASRTGERMRNELTSAPRARQRISGPRHTPPRDGRRTAHRKSALRGQGPRCSTGGRGRGSVHSVAMAWANWSTLPGFTNRPVRPCSTISSNAPMREVMTGTPRPIASVSTRPKLSNQRLGMTANRRESQKSATRSRAKPPPTRPCPQ